VNAPDGSRLYWCAVPEPREFVARVQERVAMHLNLMQRSGRLARARGMLSAYYGHGTDGDASSAWLQDKGEDGEVTALHINSVRPVVNNTMSLICGVEPVVKARAKNGDAKTLAQTRLADSLLAAYDASTSSKEAELDVVRGGLLASTWTLGQAWMPRDGNEWARDENGRPQYEGDIDVFVLPFWRCVYDFSASEASKRKWGIFRRTASRYDTAAQLEEQGRLPDALKVKKHVSSTDGSMPAKWQGIALPSMGALDALFGEELPQEDVIWVWEVRHLPSPALPEGRLVRYVDCGEPVVLFDSLAEGVKYPYDSKELHLYEFCPERVVTGSGGHTGAFDLGAMQQFMDICTASVATQVSISGQVQFWSPDEQAPQVRALSTGNTVINSRTKPEVLDNPALKPEVLRAMEWVSGQLNQAMALNNVVMGQPDKGMPASAQALQRAQAMQFHAVAQGERVRLRARNANGKLKLLKRFALAPRITEMAGTAKQYEVREWKAEDISDVERFDVEPINPTSATFEGRQSMLEMLMQMGAIRTPDALLTFLQTGSLESITSTATAQRELVESNVALLQKGIGPPKVDMKAMAPLLQEALEQGLPPPMPVFLPPEEGEEVLMILKSDPHHLAIPAYVGVLSSPASRNDATLMQACTEAIQLSLTYWQALTPDEAQCYGVPPLPSHLAAAGGMPPPPGEGPPGEGPPPVGGEMPDDGQPEMPKPAEPPENPLTGEQDSSTTGLVQ
jgi:hypothetical protein